VKQSLRLLLGALLLAGAGTVLLRVPAEAQTPGRLLIALSSYKDNLGYPRIYFYRHDGVGSGAYVDSPPPGTTRSDFRPALTPDGRLCLFNTEGVGQLSRFMLWDVPGKAELPFPLPVLEAADMTPSMSADGNLVAFSSRGSRPGPSGWNVFVFRRDPAGFLELPGLNSDDDDRMCTLSGEGKLLAYASSREGGAGLQDIYLYDLAAKKRVEVPGLNSPSRETEPWLSADGRWLTFVSTRPTQPNKPAGTGSLDVYLYDLREKKLVDLPGLNGPGPDQSPTLSPNGRHLAFVSERLGNEGHRDIYLYDRAPEDGKPRLLPLPGLNSPRDEVDPALAYVGE
jgi:Tol biopolymer transport system component